MRLDKFFSPYSDITVLFRGIDPSAGNFVFKIFHAIAPSFFRVGFRSGELPAAASKKWQGLSRYYTASEKPDPFDGHEYAKLSTILDTPMLELTYHTDVAGERLYLLNA